MSFDDNLRLKIFAWFLQYPFYILWFFIKIFLKREKNLWDTIQAPQNPKTIIITGASQGLFIYCSYIFKNVLIQVLVKVL
jgi:hypothetical protein